MRTGSAVLRGWLVPVGGRPVADGTVVVQDRVVVYAGPASRLSRPVSGTVEVDVGDSTVLPRGGRPVLPAAPAPGADYVRARRHGQTVYLAGQLPFVDGQLLRTGRVGDGLDVADGRGLARLAALNALAVADAELGSLDGVSALSMTVFVASTPDFTRQHPVADGSSGALTEVLGERGAHVRTGAATPVLPLDSPVEVQLVAWARIEHVAAVLGRLPRPAISGPSAVGPLVRPQPRRNVDGALVPSNNGLSPPASIDPIAVKAFAPLFDPCRARRNRRSTSPLRSSHRPVGRWAGGPVGPVGPVLLGGLQGRRVRYSRVPWAA